MEYADRMNGRSSTGPRAGLLLLAIFCVALVVAAALVYKHDFVFVCRDSLPTVFCAALSGAAPRVLSVVGILTMASMIRPAVLRQVAAALRPTLAWDGIALIALGSVLIFAPWILNKGLPGAVDPSVFVALWLSGLAVAGAGLTHTLFPLKTVFAALKPAALPVGGLVAFGLLLPEVALTLQPIWKMPWLSELTFDTVIAALTFFGQPVVSDATTKMIGIDEFMVLVGPQCSGVEGLALITVFLATYIFLFRDQLRLGRALLLFPIGLVASWTLNSIRIAVLLLIGRYVSPELAIEGFHSHAGWLMFMLLSVSLAAGAHRVRWLQKSGAISVAESTQPRPSFFADRATVLILPFAVFMASSTLTSAISETPAMLYPVRMAFVAVLIALGWSVVRALPWRIDPLSLATGLACGALWVATSGPASATDALLESRLAELSSVAFFGWIVVRLLGTSVVVPLVEEFFFRGYILAKLDKGGMAWRILALVVSTGIFAAMHDRYIAAASAGLLFGLIYLRRGNLTDAVVSHAGANAVIAGWALVHGDFSVI
ncbi:exosortase E/protease, VPEID-CTERM system [Meridianimarinicoccus aquatilis]|uniref:Exosortase E/protease, VPEID-CTERM system n=1 Tax=Meridianimarinicoccus aquatilis TaxID=2552766 RepID=A0A4V3BAW1_9RHOB|nr:exosortase E/protease, VPEID-CTERM system [Fluviibacterium aquatile]TDL84709.1 exosortase E/protease, VPEID-CTERM system [Fluviibacterium aquatile]